MKLTFDDIINKKHLDPVEHEIDGLGVVSLHPLSAVEAYDCINSPEKPDNEELEVYIAKWCCRMLKGSTATDDEVDCFRNNNTISVIRSIYIAGLSANAVSAESNEQIEKN